MEEKNQEIARTHKKIVKGFDGDWDERKETQRVDKRQERVDKSKKEKRKVGKE